MDTAAATFDLNLDNYSRSELRAMFELPPRFDARMVEARIAALTDSILRSATVGANTKTQTMQFLATAKAILLSTADRATAATATAAAAAADRDYVSSFPTEFVPGLLNPLKKKTLHKVLNIDTRFRDNYLATSAANYSLTLPLHIDNVLQMQLSAIELPAAATHFALSKQLGNNFFAIRWGDNARDLSLPPTLVALPNGTYTPATLLATINAALDELGTDIRFLANSSSSSSSSSSSPSSSSSSPASFPPADDNAALVATSASGTPWTLSFQTDRLAREDRHTPLPTKIGWPLGFRHGEYAGAATYAAEGRIELAGPKYLYFALDDYNNNVSTTFYSLFNASVLNKTILARIAPSSSFSPSSPSSPSSSASPDNNIVTVPREYFGPVSIANLHIQLLDEYGRVADLCNMDYSFCLTLVTAYDI